MARGLHRDVVICAEVNASVFSSPIDCVDLALLLLLLGERIIVRVLRKSISTTSTAISASSSATTSIATPTTSVATTATIATPGTWSIVKD